MSSLIIKALHFKPEGLVSTDLMELENAHAGAPVIWNYTRNYFSKTEIDWNAWKNPQMSRAVALCFVFTFDYGYIPKKHFKAAAQAIRQMLNDFMSEKYFTFSHWRAIADALSLDPDCDGVGFHWTTVGDDLFEDCEVSKLWDFFEEFETGPKIRTRDSVVWLDEKLVDTLFSVDYISPKGTAIGDFGDGELSPFRLESVRLATEQEKIDGFRHKKDAFVMVGDDLYTI